MEASTIVFRVSLDVTRCYDGNRHRPRRGMRPVAGDGVEAFDRLDLVVPPPISGRSFLNCRQRSFRSAMLSNRPPQR